MNQPTPTPSPSAAAKAQAELALWQKRCGDLYELVISLKRHASEAQSMYGIHAEDLIADAENILSAVNSNANTDPTPASGAASETPRTAELTSRFALRDPRLIDEFVCFERELTAALARAERAEKERDEAKRWTKEAKVVLDGIDIQGIGKALNLPLGRQIGPEILPAPTDPCASELAEALEVAEDALRCAKSVMGYGLQDSQWDGAKDCVKIAHAGVLRALTRYRQRSSPRDQLSRNDVMLLKLAEFSLNLSFVDSAVRRLLKGVRPVGRSEIDRIVFVADLEDLERRANDAKAVKWPESDDQRSSPANPPTATLSEENSRLKERVVELEKPSVFELVEQEDAGEQYFTLGLFRSLQEAIDMVEANGVNLCDDPQEHVRFEIRERIFGCHPLDVGKMVYARGWTEDFGEESDAAPQWKICEQFPSPPATAKEML